MRRLDIQLLARARQGDRGARLEAGRRYLAGADGFPLHIRTGISYLTHPSILDSPMAPRIIAESLALEDIVHHQQLGSLTRAAGSGSCAAQIKLAAWLLLRDSPIAMRPTHWVAPCAEFHAELSARVPWRRVQTCEKAWPCCCAQPMPDATKPGFISIASMAITGCDSERANQWLHQAANAKDAHAARLLNSLVLPLEGGDDDASWATELVERDDPWLALRLRLSRQFGLTRLEALCVDPAQGLRPWGLVAGKNPFTTQIRLSAARAIPAMSSTAMEVAKRAASFFGQENHHHARFEGDLRRRMLRQHRLFERHGLDEAMFFASATTTTLESLRLGPKWAFRAKAALQMAPAA